MKEIIYNIQATSNGRTITITGLTEPLEENNLLGIINKTQSELLYSPMHKKMLSSVTYSNGTLTIVLTNIAPEIKANDKLLIKLYSDSDSGSIDEAKDEIMGKATPYDCGASVPACLLGETYYDINSDHELTYENDYELPQDFGVGSVVTAVDFDPTSDYYLANVVGAGVALHYDGQDFSITGVTNWLKVEANKCYRCTAVIELTYTADGETHPYPDSGEQVTTVYLYVYEEYDPNGKSTEDVFNALKNINIDTTELAKEASVKDSSNNNVIDVAKDNQTKIGTTADSTISSTLFGWLKSIRDFLVDIVTTNPYAKEATLGASSDTSAQSTIFGKLAAVLSAMPSTSGLASESSVSDNSDTTIGLLKDNTNGLSAIKTSASSAATDAAAAKTAAQAITGYATETNATANKNAILQAISDNAGVPTLTIPSTTASQELAPNTLYIFSSRSTALTITLGNPITGIANEYHLFLVTDSSTAPTVTWPSGISWNGGSAPSIAANKTYEVSILNNVAAFFEV